MVKNIFVIFVILGTIILPYSPNLRKLNLSINATTEVFNYSIDKDTTWTLVNSPYIIGDDHGGAILLIQEGATLTIEPGVVVKMKTDASISVEGELIARGEENNPVIFTSYNDNIVEENCPACNPPQPGDWRAITVEGEGRISLDNAIVRYGGYEVYYYEKNDNYLISPSTAYAEIADDGEYHGAISIKDEAQAVITNSIIASNTIGIEINNLWAAEEDGARINNSQIINNTEAGIINNSEENMDATGNWWGHKTGPYHEADNQGGQGEKIFGNVEFAPWLAVSPAAVEPAEPEADPVIIVPGIMGSWKKHGSWVIDPLLHTYDNLVEAMVRSGYVIGEDLFLFPYDWRGSNVLTADLLKEKIAEVKNKSGKQKVDLVAHSMGGLVARYYIQSNEYGDDVDQVIFLDAPHQGSPESYLTYEGAYFYKDFFGLEKFQFQIEAIKHGYLSLAKYIREQIISVEQLLPVYNYLQEKVDNNWQYRIYPVQYPENDFLVNLNVAPAVNALKNRVKVTNIISTTETNSTLSAFKVISDPNIYDSKWMDGYPINIKKGDLNSLITGDGDGTVPYSSLNYLDGVQIIEIADSEHREIVTKAQQDVIEILTGERPLDYYSGPWPAIKRLLFIRVYSPVDFHVIAPNGEMVGKNFIDNIEINQIPGAFYSGFDAEDEFVTIINPADGDYRVEVQGTDNGAYELGIDILEENSVKNFTGNLISGVIGAGQEENFNFNYSDDCDEVEIRKEVDFDILLQDLDELYKNNEITKAVVYKVLKIGFRHLGMKYDKMKTERRKKIKNIIQKFIIKFSLNKISRALKFNLDKGRITQTAFDVLSDDINSIVNKLN